MKGMTSPSTWFGIRSKSNSKRSISPIPPSEPFSNTIPPPIRSSLLRSRSPGSSCHEKERCSPSHSTKSQELADHSPRLRGEPHAVSSTPQTMTARTCRDDLVRTYLAWVNAHLKRRNASERVLDLTTGFQDGVTLLTLVEAVSGKEISGVLRQSNTPQQREEIVNVVLAFLLSEGLDLNAVSAAQIMDGDLKSVLKVIYSLACHYKCPAAASHNSSEFDRNNPHSSPALREYASLKQQVNEFEKKVRDNALIAKYRRLSINSNILSDIEANTEGDETDVTACDSDENTDLEVHIPQTRGEPIYVNLSLCNTSYQANRGNQSKAGLDHILRVPFTATAPSKQLSPKLGVKNREVHVYCDHDDEADPSLPLKLTDAPAACVQQTDVSISPIDRNDPSKAPTVSVESGESFEECYDKLSLSLRELQPIKEQIRAVQSVLSASSTPNNLGLGMTVNTLTSQLAELQQKYKDKCCQLSESEQQTQQLSSDLSSVIQECTDLSNRLTESLSIRADVLRKDYLLHNSESENLALRIAAREKEEVIKQLNAKLALRQQLVTTLEDQVAELQREKERRVKGIVTGSGSHSTLSSLSDSVEAPTHLSIRVKEVCDTLFTLRGRVSEDASCSQLLDSMEEGLYVIVERLYYYTARCLKKYGNRSEGRGAHSPRTNSRNRSLESPKSTRASLDRSNSSLNATKENSGDLDPNELIVFDICQTPDYSFDSIPRKSDTRVLYFLDQADAPYQVDLSMPASEVTLADIKSQNCRVGTFAYHFKVYDPEFGAVKEELTKDTDLVPVYKKNTIVVHLESNEP